MKSLNVYKVDFEGIYPVGNCLIICAEDMVQARKIAKETITHTDVFTINKVALDKPKVIEYLSGDY